MLRFIRRLGWMVLLLVLLGALALYVWIQQRAPVRDGQQTLAGLSQPVTVTYDTWGVPHIVAQSEEDAMYAFGYVHAQDRLFQMDLLRRVGAGRLAELFGDKVVPTDTLFRTLGIQVAASRYAAQLATANTPEAKSARAYVKGINAFIAQKRWPVEYTLLGVAPAPYTLTDIGNVGGVIAYGFSQGFQEDPLISALSGRLGKRYLNDLVFNWPGETAPVKTTPTGGVNLFPQHGPRSPIDEASPQAQNATASLLLAFAQQVRNVNATLPVSQLQGSNAWALSGKHTQSGKPLYANDPHIGFSAPAVWYEADIQTPGWHVYGHFLGGVPVPLLTHNAHHATGLTMWENDETDFYTLDRNPKNPLQVWEGGRWQLLEKRVEIINIKDAAPLKLDIFTSKHGPVVNGLYPSLASRSRAIAVSWTFLDPHNQPLAGLYAISHAQNFAQMQQAVSLHWSPGLNLSYADQDGNIALWAIGRQTRRAAGVNSHLLLNGSSGKQDNFGFAPFSQNPRVVNPANGVIYSANHPYLDTGAGIIPGYYPAPDRVERLRQLLPLKDTAQGATEPTGAKKWTVATMQALQGDVINPTAAQHCRAWLAQLPAATRQRDATLVNVLQNWNGRYGLSDTAPTVCERWQLFLVDGLFGDELSGEELKQLKVLFILDKSLPRIIANPGSPWWDDVTTPAVETESMQIARAWQRTLASLRAQFGNRIADWRWGEIHTLTHGHPLGKVAALAPLFNVGPFALPGGRDTLDNQYTNLEETRATVRSGPSTRRVVDLAHPAQAIGINPVGQSGVLFDPHHHDQAALFLQHQYRPLWLSPADIAAHRSSTLTFTPAQP